MERVLIMMIGVPGSGKSTYAKNLQKDFGFPIVSSDKVRGELYGDESNQSNPAVVFNLVYKRVSYFLDQVGICILDATNCSRKNRRTAIKRLRPTKIFYILMDVDIQTCKEQNAARDRVVPDYVIDKMEKDFWLDFPWDDRLYFDNKNIWVYSYKDFDGNFVY